MATVNIKGVKYLIRCSNETAKKLAGVYGETDTIETLLYRIKELEDQLWALGEEPYGDGTDCSWDWNDYPLPGQIMPSRSYAEFKKNGFDPEAIVRKQEEDKISDHNI